MTAGLWILLIVSIILVAGGIGMLIYGLHKHEDVGEKTTTNKLLIGAGLALIVIGVVMIIFFIFRYRSNSKSQTVVLETPSLEMSNMNNLRNYQGGEMNNLRNYQGGNPGNMSMYGGPQGYYPTTPVYSPGPEMGYSQGGFSGEPMNQWNM